MGRKDWYGVRPSAAFNWPTWQSDDSGSDGFVPAQNPTGYAQVVQENFSGSPSANRELTRAFVYGLERVSQLRSYLVTGTIGEHQAPNTIKNQILRRENNQDESIT